MRMQVRLHGGSFLVTVLIIALIAVLYLTISSPAAYSVMAFMQNGPVYRGEKADAIALECAVSWDAAALEPILDILSERDAKITFLISGEWAKTNAEMLQKIMGAGHEIGTIGMQPYKDGDIKWVKADILSSLDQIYDACGTRPVLYYSGERNTAVSSKAADELKLIHVSCTTDLLSARGESKDIINRAADKLRQGNILLFEPTAAIAESLPAILETIENMGCKPVSVGYVLKEET